MGILIAFLLFCWIALMVLDAIISDKYDHSFLVYSKLKTLAIAEAILGYGVWCYSANSAADSNQAAWFVLTVGILIVAYCLCRNIKRTNFRFGIVGTVFQLPVALCVLIIGIGGLVIACIASGARETTYEDALHEQWRNDKKNPCGSNYDRTGRQY
jgi:uncharacterized integral membrane protein